MAAGMMLAPPFHTGSTQAFKFSNRQKIAVSSLSEKDGGTLIIRLLSMTCIVINR